MYSLVVRFSSIDYETCNQESSGHCDNFQQKLVPILRKILKLYNADDWHFELHDQKTLNLVVTSISTLLDSLTRYVDSDRTTQNRYPVTPNYPTIQPTAILEKLDFLITIMDQVYAVGDMSTDDSTRIYLDLTTSDVFFDLFSTYVKFSRYLLSRKWLENSPFDRLISMASRVHLNNLSPSQAKKMVKITDNLFYMALDKGVIHGKSQELFRIMLEKVKTSQKCQTLVGDLVLKLTAYNLHGAASSLLQVLSSSWGDNFTSTSGLFDGCSFEQWSQYYRQQNVLTSQNCKPTEVYNWIRTESIETSMQDFCDKKVGC